MRLPVPWPARYATPLPTAISESRGPTSNRFTIFILVYVALCFSHLSFLLAKLQLVSSDETVCFL